MTSQPDISIVLPVHNCAATIDATIASVLAQSHADFELIAIDDGSRDDSLQRLLRWADRDPRLRVISKLNAGVSSARNLGAELARAPLLAFIDGDDLWAPGKLAAHLERHRADPCLAASYARIAFIAEQADDLAGAATTSSLPAGQLGLIDVLGENPVCTASNLVVRRDWFNSSGGFDRGLSFAEDQDFVASLIARGAVIGGIDAVLVGYRLSPAGLSLNLEKMHLGWRLVAQRYLSGPALASREALYYRYLARRVLRSGGSAGDALGYAWRGLRIDAASFLAERRRGLSTLAGVLAAPLLTSAWRRRLFA